MAFFSRESHMDASTYLLQSRNRAGLPEEPTDEQRLAKAAAYLLFLTYLPNNRSAVYTVLEDRRRPPMSSLYKDLRQA